MGAHLSTIQAKVADEFKRCDEGCKGYLVVKEVMNIKTPYGISPCHLGVLYKIDKDEDARFTLQELLDFAAWAQRQYHGHRGADAGYMVSGACSLGMWQVVHHQRERFIDWALSLFTEGYELKQLEYCSHMLVHRKAIKALHVLFDMERNQGVDYQTLQHMLQVAAAEQGQLDLGDEEQLDWVPLIVLRSFLQALTEGMDNLMESVFVDNEELQEVLHGIETAGTQRGSTSGSGGTGPRSARGPASSGGGSSFSLQLAGLQLACRQKQGHRL